MRQQTEPRFIGVELEEIDFSPVDFPEPTRYVKAWDQFTKQIPDQMHERVVRAIAYFAPEALEFGLTRRPHHSPSD